MLEVQVFVYRLHGVTFTTGGALQKSALRQANERLVLNAIRVNSGISRSDLARLTGLSPSSISFIVNRLIRERMLLEERVENHTQVGRRPTALRLVNDARMVVGVEIGLAKSRVVLADLTGAFVREKSIPWHSDHEVLAQSVQAAILAFQAEAAPRRLLGVGVGLPGTIDKATGKVIAAENLNWFNVEFGKAVSGRLSLPFYFENSARLTALAERWFVEPGGAPMQDFIYVEPTGGLGTGIVTNGHLLQGAASMGGECGHIMIYPDGLECTCGNSGCWEQYASDRALCRRYAEYSGSKMNCGDPPAPVIVEKAREGDAAALRAVEQTAEALGLGLVNLIWVFNPQAVIVGGFVADAWDLMETPVWKVLYKRAPGYTLSSLRIFPSRHAADSGLLGAVSLVLAHYFTRFEHGDAPEYRQPVLIHASR